MRPVGLSRGWRVTLRAAAALALGGVFASQSRGAIVAIFVSWWRSRSSPVAGAKALAVSVSALALVAASIAVPGSPVNAAFQTRGLNTSGRNDLWTVASRMIAANPVGGVGVGNFKNSSVNYLLRPGGFTRSQYIVDTPQPVHNSYLQVGAETGLVGLLLFVGIVAGSVASAWHAARRFERARDRGWELIARALVLAMLAMLTAVFFLTYTDYGRPLWILLALGPALLAVSRSPSQRPFRPSPSYQRVRPTSRSAIRPGSKAPEVPRAV